MKAKVTEMMEYVLKALENKRFTKPKTTRDRPQWLIGKK